MALRNVYQVSTIGGSVVATSTPGDGLDNNILLGSIGDDSLYGESTAYANNEFYAGPGDDAMFVSTAIGQINLFHGGEGGDAAVVAYAHNVPQVQISATGGVTLYRPTGGFDAVDGETEIVEFTDGHRLVNISAGAMDHSVSETLVYYRPGDTLAISSDWLYALNTGLVHFDVYDYNQDGTQDTSLVGLNGVNTYRLLDYDMNTHASFIVGQFGSGLLLDLA